MAAAERMAWLSASLPPEVKIISLASQLSSPATVSLARSSASFASWPKAYRLEGLPYCS